MSNSSGVFKLYKCVSSGVRSLSETCFMSSQKRHHKSVIMDILNLSKSPKLTDMSGGNGITYCVNGTHFVKIATTRLEILRLRKEAALSVFLQGKLPVQVPRIKLFSAQYYDEQKKELKNIVCGTSECIAGETFQNPKGSYLMDQESIAEQIGELVSAMHKIDVSQLPSEVPTYEDFLFENMRDSYAEVSEPVLRDVLLSSISTQIPYAHEKSVLCHMDLHWGNLVFDFHHSKIVGLLDFGEAVKGPYAADLACAVEHSNTIVLKTYRDIIPGPSLLPEKVMDATSKKIISHINQTMRHYIRS